MEKKTKQVHKSAEEVSVELADQKEAQIDQDVANQIEKILKDNDRALQPFIPDDHTFGIFPRVRLVRQVAPKEDVEEAA